MLLNLAVITVSSNASKLNTTKRLLLPPNKLILHPNVVCNVPPQTSLHAAMMLSSVLRGLKR